MYRTNVQSRAVEEELIYAGLRYKLIGGTKFYQRREIKFVISFLKVLSNTSDSTSLTSILKAVGKGIGSKMLSVLTTLAEDNGISLFTILKTISNSDTNIYDLSSRTITSVTNFYYILNSLVKDSNILKPVELVDTILDKSGYSISIREKDNNEEIWENLQELRTVASEYDKLEPREGLRLLLEKISLVADTDDIDSSDSITLITLHKAKGLEYPVVFIIGMEEGLLPHSSALVEEEDELEEERRLCYVGMTRAEKYLYLLYTIRRSILGTSTDRIPSRFLKDIKDSLIENIYTN
jgi:DNA helicase-2/ATP-dependent DNA helicase PcrA